MTDIGIEPSLYLLKMVEANIVHLININANKCQKEPITNTKSISLDKKIQPVIYVQNDSAHEPLEITYFDDIKMIIHFTIVSSEKPNHEGSYPQELITSTSFVFIPPPLFPVQTPTCCIWPPEMKYEQQYGIHTYPPSTPWIRTKLHSVMAPSFPISLTPLSVPVQTELLRWSNDGNPADMKNRFYPSVNGKTQLREPSDYLYGMSENMSSLKLSYVQQLDETLPQLRQHRQHPRLRNVRKPFRYNEYTRTIDQEINIQDRIDSNLTEEQRLLVGRVREDLHPNSKVNQTNPEYHVDDDFYNRPLQQTLVSKNNAADPLVERPVLQPLKPKDKHNGSLEEQFEDAPQSHSETSFDLPPGTSGQTTSDPTNRAASTIPEVHIGNDNVIATRAQRMAENLHQDKKSIEFLTALKDLVDFYPVHIETLYLEPVLTFDKDTGLYSMDLHACTEPLWRIISYLMEQNEQHEVLGMDQESFESFYKVNMKKWKPPVKKKGPKKVAPVPNKNPAKPTEEENDIVEVEQTPQEKVTETHDNTNDQ